jgi:hypothetical protein
MEELEENATDGKIDGKEESTKAKKKVENFWYRKTANEEVKA